MQNVEQQHASTMLYITATWKCNSLIFLYSLNSLSTI